MQFTPKERMEIERLSVEIAFAGKGHLADAVRAASQGWHALEDNGGWPARERLPWASEEEE